MSGVFLRQGDELVAMTETEYEAESVLQELLARYPALLAGENDGGLLLIRREAAVDLGDDGALRGSLDHLFVDSAGVPTLVEVKRSSDSRIRREVVGQMLDYAANAAAHWGNDALRRLFEDRCTAAGKEPDETLSEAFADVTDPDRFWELVHTNLAAGRLRLIFVADAIPSALRRIVEFLNAQLTQTEVLAIEVKQYRDATGEHQTLVPQVLGRTEAARQLKGQPEARRWSRETMLAELGRRFTKREVEFTASLLDWIDRRGDLSLWFGSGKKDGSFQAGYSDRSRYTFPFALYTYGRIEIHFQYLARRPPFSDAALREELRRRLNAINGVQIGEDMLAKRPSIDLATLAEPSAKAQFLDALDWVFKQADRAANAG